METLLDLLAEAVAANVDKTALSLRLDDGTTATWSYRELERRSRLAAWRLRGLGLTAGDRLLTWSPSTPALPAVYFGAMRAGLILVPLDLRMSAEAVENVVEVSGARHLVLGTGRDAPDPRDAGLDRFPTTPVDALVEEPDATFPVDWEAQLDAWPAPSPRDVFELVFTSGTTGTPKGVMLAHDNVVAAVESFHRLIPPMEHRIVSLLPLSHLLEQSVGLYYALSVGADILYVRSRNPRVIFDALRDHRVTSMVVVPQVLDLFWSAIEREVARRDRERAFERLRAIARRLPMGLRPTLFRSVHRQLGGHFRLFLSAGAFLPPALQQAWEDLGVTVLPGLWRDRDRHGQLHDAAGPRARDGGAAPGRDRDAARRRRRDPVPRPDGVPRLLGEPAGDGRGVHAGRLVPDRRHRPPRQRRPPDPVRGARRHDRAAERVQRVSRGHRERAPDRRDPRFRRPRDRARPIEAVVLGSAASPPAAPGARAHAAAPDPAALRERIDAAVKAANGTLGANQRIAGWRLWPDEDFPRTHTLKVKRALIRDWVAADRPTGDRSAGDRPVGVA
jgi:long-chain acyl-CoA synthetase